MPLTHNLTPKFKSKSNTFITISPRFNVANQQHASHRELNRTFGHHIVVLEVHPIGVALLEDPQHCRAQSSIPNN